MHLRRTVVSGLVVCLGMLGGVCGDAGIAQAQNSMQRGEYLVNIMACNDCHTPMGPGGQPIVAFKLAGHPPDAPVASYQGGPFGSFSLTNTSWAGPWGVSFTRNLTPDPDTGLGKWTEADFIKAIRTGHRPDGTLMLPPMPWPVYAHATDEDLKAIWAYLRSLPPIKNAVPANIPPKK